MIDVISIGAATVDIFVKSDQFKIDNSLLSLPVSSKNEMTDSLICSGGGATNSSVSFSRLELKSTCLSLLGDDPLGLYVFKDLKDSRVDTNLLIHQQSEITDYSIILVGPDGSRSILTNRGPTHLEASQIDWDKISGTGWFYITSLEGNLDLLEQLVGFAREHTIKVSLNPGNRELAQSPRLLPLLPYVNFLLLNKTESEELTGLSVDNDQLWSKLSSYGSAITAVTDGRNGAYILADGNKLYSPIINTQPVDETGAGDAFGSTFIAAQIHGLDLPASLHWAIKNSASVVSALGAKPGLLTFSQIK
ncbi:MAG: carbohydrate kinase family protein [Candidatus Shapirobacteria bacterium]|nr:carbohydrate kinase family protein [Candidatus Shapirobacteria bacterium]